MPVSFYLLGFSCVTFKPLGVLLSSIVQEWVTKLPANEQFNLLALHGMAPPAGVKDAGAAMQRWARRCIFYTDAEKQTTLNIPVDTRDDLMFGSVVSKEIVYDVAYSDSYRYALSKGAMPPSKEDNNIAVDKKLLIDWGMFIKPQVTEFMLMAEHMPVSYIKTMMFGADALSKHPNAKIASWWQDFAKLLNRVTNITIPGPSAEPVSEEVPK